MDSYESERYSEIRAWQAEPPPPVARLLGRAAGPASRAVQTMVPGEALQMALDAVFDISGRLDREDSILKLAGLSRIEQLRDRPLAECDRLARHVQRRSTLVGAGSGAAFGIAGAAGLVADVPSLLVLALRVIRRTGLCYGERLQGANGRRLAIAIFALASANTVEEKRAALKAVAEPDSHTDMSVDAWRDGIERAAERELAKDAATASLNNLAGQLTRHLGWRKASAMVPVIGAVIGGSVNAWYLHDVARVARLCFQERWLAQRHHRHSQRIPLRPPASGPQPAAAG